MARPKKKNVDYFPHQCNHGQTIFILEQKYGNDGYAFWFKLLELIGNAEDHYLQFENPEAWEFLQAKTRLKGDTCKEILDLLARLNAIDRELWEKNKVVWCQKFVDNVADVYRNRRVEIPAKPSFYNPKPPQEEVSTPEKPQSKVNKTKVNKSKENNNTSPGVEKIPHSEIVTYLNNKAGKNFRVTSKTRDLIRARWNEGFVLKDFQTVIDKKTLEWLETDMEKYIRPETLFSNKFDSYFNQGWPVKKKSKVDLVNERLKIAQEYEERGFGN